MGRGPRRLGNSPCNPGNAVVVSSHGLCPRLYPDEESAKLRRKRSQRMWPQRNSGVPILERQEPAPANNAADWEAIRLFLEVARRGSFRAAADALGVSINTLRRQIDELEQQLAVKLLTRHVDGVRTTTE